MFELIIKETVRCDRSLSKFAYFMDTSKGFDIVNYIKSFDILCENRISRIFAI